jgi:hypothetical protein
MEISDLKFRKTTKVESGRIMKFILLEEFKFILDEPLTSYDIIDCKIELRGRELTIKEGFLWDGNTPKYRLFGVWIGIPDFKRSIRGSLVHDALLRLIKRKPYSIHRKDIDDVWYKILEYDRFTLRRLFYVAVRLWGVLRGG